MARVFRASSSPWSAGELRHHPKEPVQIPHNCFGRVLPLFAEQYYVNAGMMIPETYLSVGAILLKFLGRAGTQSVSRG